MAVIVIGFALLLLPQGSALLMLTPVLDPQGWSARHQHKTMFEKLRAGAMAGQLTACPQ
jgi:hypothetical protein